LAGIGAVKYRVRYNRSGTLWRLYAVSPPKITFCYDSSRNSVPSLVTALTVVPRKCPKEQEELPEDEQDPSGGVELGVRSVYQIIEYLGQVLRFQDQKAAENRCVKFAGDRSHRSCDETDVLFKVNALQGSPLVTTVHQGSPYAISIAPCSQAYCDHFAEVLKILSLLININKSATDIPQVPLVRVIQ
jgi:hypothetical protein